MIVTADAFTLVFAGFLAAAGAYCGWHWARMVVRALNKILGGIFDWIERRFNA